MHRRFRRSSLRGLLAVAAIALVLPASASAEAKLGISPLKVQMSGAAGSTQTTTISLSAEGDEDLSIRFAHLDFGLSDNYSVVLISDAAKETTSFSTRRWFSVPRTTFRIPAGTTVNVPLKVRIPPNTPGGTYLGIASFVSSAASSSAGQIRTSVAAGTELFIAVDGGSPPKPRISKLDVPRVVSDGPIRPRLTVTNDGDEYFALEGTARIDGAKRGGSSIGEQYVLPHQPRVIQTSSTKDTVADRRRAALVVGTSSLGIGRHELVVRLRISPTNATVVARRTFWVVPAWAWALGSLLVLALVGGIVTGTLWLVRRRRRNQVQAATVTAPEPDPNRGEFDTMLGIDDDPDDDSDQV